MVSLKNDELVKSQIWDGKVKVQNQGAQITRNGAYLVVRDTTRDAAQHRWWFFYEAIKK
jgi:hypothetical protein